MIVSWWNRSVIKKGECLIHFVTNLKPVFPVASINWLTNLNAYVGVQASAGFFAFVTIKFLTVAIKKNKTGEIIGEILILALCAGFIFIPETMKDVMVAFIQMLTQAAKK